MSSPVSIYAEAYVKMHGFDITLGSPSKGDTRYDLTSLCLMLLILRSEPEPMSGSNFSFVNIYAHNLPIFPSSSIYHYRLCSGTRNADTQSTHSFYTRRWASGLRVMFNLTHHKIRGTRIQFRMTLTRSFRIALLYVRSKVVSPSQAMNSVSFWRVMSILFVINTPFRRP
jgi:hypothetical protein